MSEIKFRFYEDKIESEIKSPPSFPDSYDFSQSCFPFISFRVPEEMVMTSLILSTVLYTVVTWYL